MNRRHPISETRATLALFLAVALVACGGEPPADRNVSTPVAAADQRATTPGANGPDDARPASGAGNGDDGAAATDGSTDATDPAASRGGSGVDRSDDTDAGTAAADRVPDAAPASSRPTSGSGPEPSPPGDASEGQAGGDPAARSPETILRATAQSYEGLRSVRAGFHQTLRNTLLGRTVESSGTLYQRQPDRFLMDFSDPAGDVIVSDGEYFWMYFPSVDRRQVIRMPRSGQGLDLRSQFIGDPVRRFETTYHGTESVRGRTTHVMTLVPREPAGYESLKVWIDDSDHLVRRFELREGNGIVRHFELSDLVRNPSLSDDLFEFTPPEGAQMVSR